MTPRQAAALFLFLALVANSSLLAAAAPAPRRLSRLSPRPLTVGDPTPKCVGVGAVCTLPLPGITQVGICGKGYYCPPLPVTPAGKHLTANCTAAPPSGTSAADVYLSPCKVSTDCVWASIPEGPISSLRCAVVNSTAGLRCVNTAGSAGDACNFDVECASEKCDPTTKRCLGLAQGAACSPSNLDGEDDDGHGNSNVSYDDEGIFGWRSTVTLDTCDSGLYCKTSSPSSSKGTCVPLLHVGEPCPANEHNDEADDDAFFGGCGDGTVCARQNDTHDLCVPSLSAAAGSFGRACSCASGYANNTDAGDDDTDLCVGPAPRKFQTGDTCDPYAAVRAWEPWFACGLDLNNVPRLMANAPCSPGYTYPSEPTPVDFTRELIACVAKAKCRSWMVVDPLAPPRIGSCQYACIDEYRVIAESLMLSLKRDTYFTPQCGQWSAAIVAEALEHGWARQTLPGYPSSP